MTKRLDNSRLLDLAVAGRESRAVAYDPILSIGVTVLDLQDSIDELYDKIQKDTVFGSDGNGKPRAVCFKHPVMVEDLERNIASLQETMGVLTDLLSHIEEKFAKHGVTAKALYSLNEDLTALQEEPSQVARAITRRVNDMINNNPTIPLAMVFADEEVQALEQKKAQAAVKNELQIANIIKLKDALMQDTNEGRRIVESVRHPGRIALTPAMVELAESPTEGEEVL